MAQNAIANCLYHYKADIISVYDGDTVTANVDLGFNITLTGVKLRLLRINAPELRGEEKEQGKLSRDHLKALILNKKVIIRTQLKAHDSFGRILADIYLDGVDINAKMVNDGFAEFKTY